MYMLNQFPQFYFLSMVAGRIQRIFIICRTGLMLHLSMCSNIFCFAICWFILTKKNCQGNNNINWSPLDHYQVYHDIRNTAGFWWWNTWLYFSHANLDLFIVCILPRWNIVIHTVSWKLILLIACSLLSKPRTWNKRTRTHPFWSLLLPGSHYFLPTITCCPYWYPRLVCCYCY